VQAFDYVSARDKAQAISLLAAAADKTEILAGGTDLLALMKDDVVAPRRLVNIKDIEELDGISFASDGMRIGALTTLAELVENTDVRKRYPALADALIGVASPQIRNLATLGGNLCQRPRCWYFRNRFGLLPKDERGNELVAAGENRYHAILGNSGPAKFVSPSTIVPILIAYRARIRIEGPKGRRELALEDFFVTPRTDGAREHDVRPNEIVTEVLLPSASGVHAAHYEIRQKDAFDWPLAVAAVALRIQGSNVESARVVMGYVAPVPWPSPEAEGVLRGNPPNEETATKAAVAALAGARPLSQNGYKVQLARVAVKRAILKAAQA
jgi:xanthine dehydrogenase YagS FAD-binding subunit